MLLLGVIAGVAVVSAATAAPGLYPGEGPKRKKRRWGRRLLILLVAAGLALALSEGLRQKVLDLLFGAEEEFDYSSTTTPASPAPAPGATTPA